MRRRKAPMNMLVKDKEFWKLNKYHLAMFVMRPSLHGITFTALYIIH